MSFWKKKCTEIFECNFCFFRLDGFWLKNWQDAWLSGSQRGGIMVNDVKVLYPILVSLRRELSRGRIAPRRFTSGCRVLLQWLYISCSISLVIVQKSVNDIANGGLIVNIISFVAISILKSFYVFLYDQGFESIAYDYHFSSQIPIRSGNVSFKFLKCSIVHISKFMMARPCWNPDTHYLNLRHFSGTLTGYLLD